MNKTAEITISVTSAFREALAFQARARGVKSEMFAGQLLQAAFAARVKPTGDDPELEAAVQRVAPEKGSGPASREATAEIARLKSELQAATARETKERKIAQDALGAYEAERSRVGELTKELQAQKDLSAQLQEAQRIESGALTSACESKKAQEERAGAIEAELAVAKAAAEELGASVRGWKNSYAAAISDIQKLEGREKALEQRAEGAEAALGAERTRADELAAELERAREDERGWRRNYHAALSELSKLKESENALKGELATERQVSASIAIVDAAHGPAAHEPKTITRRIVIAGQKGLPSVEISETYEP